MPSRRMPAYSFSRRAPSLLALALAGALGACSARAEAIPIRVRASAALHAQARFEPDGALELRGQLTDDARAAIAAGGIAVTLPTTLTARSAQSCARPRLRVLGAAQRVTMLTSTLGEFCARWRTAPDRGRFDVRFLGDQYHSGTHVEVAFDRAASQKAATRLRFEPRPLNIDLDRDTTVIGGVLSVTLPGAHPSLRGHAIVLEDEHRAVVARAMTAGDGKARFEVNMASVGPPGHGTLHLRFAGTDTLAAASDSQPVTRRATVRLRLLEPVAPRPPGEPAEARVAVEARKGQVSDGVVEAVRHGRSVGTAPVCAGLATLVLDLAGRRQRITAVTAHFLPASPWWKPGPPLQIDIPVRPPSAVLQLVLSLLVLTAGAWVLHSWRRARTAPHKEAPRTPLTPGVHVVAAARDGGPAAWRGQVVDAHEGQALAGAVIVVERPTAPDSRRDAQLLRCVTDEEGQFGFSLAKRPQTADIVIHRRSYSTERRSLPAPGTLRVALITRRRNVLRRFVRWTRQRGAPFFAPPEPTPAHVHNVAAGDPDVVEWAAAVEAAAFGPREVDEATEERLRTMEPGIPGSGGPNAAAEDEPPRPTDEPSPRDPRPG